MLQNSTTATITKEAEKGKTYRILADRRKMTRNQWLELRSRYCGGSDVAKIIPNGSRYGTPLSVYLDKKNLVKRQPPSEACYFGSLFEDLLVKEFSIRTGYKTVSVPYVLQSVQAPWLIADLDSVIDFGNGTYGILEIKTTNSFSGASPDDWNNGEAGNIPMEYYFQCQTYLFVTGLDICYIAVLVAGQKFFYQPIHRDPDCIEAIVKITKHWYERYFLTNTPPPAGTGDGDLLGKFYDRPERKEVQLPESAAALVDDYLSATQEIKKWEDRKKLAQVKLEEMMGNSGDTAVVGLRRISWKPVETKRFSASRAKELNLLTEEQIDQCSTVTSSRRFSVTTIKAKNK